MCLVDLRAVFPTEKLPQNKSRCGLDQNDVCTNNAGPWKDKALITRTQSATLGLDQNDVCTNNAGPWNDKALITRTQSATLSYKQKH